MAHGSCVRIAIAIDRGLMNSVGQRYIYFFQFSESEFSGGIAIGHYTVEKVCILIER